MYSEVDKIILDMKSRGWTEISSSSINMAELKRRRFNMIEKELVVGDVVRLKSGGPKMTIEKVDVDNGNAQCIWFWEDCVRTNREKFCLSCLQLSE